MRHLEVLAKKLLSSNLVCPRRQLLGSREKSCGGCEGKLPAGDWIGWEELWPRSVEISYEK
jgi:hypothetical protein